MVAKFRTLREYETVVIAPTLERISEMLEPYKDHATIEGMIATATQYADGGDMTVGLYLFKQDPGPSVGSITYMWGTWDDVSDNADAVRLGPFTLETEEIGETVVRNFEPAVHAPGEDDGAYS